MDFYELQSKGKIYVEIIDTLPIYKPSNIGRLIFDLTSKTLYFGGNSETGWIATSSFINLINNNHIYWNILFNDNTGLSIDANSIPCYSLNLLNSNAVSNISTVQNVIQDLWSSIHKILDGKYYADSSIKVNHLDLSTPDGLTASDILINNDKLYFGSPTIDISIERALEILHLRRADDIYMANNNTFGSKLNIFSNTVQDSFEGLENYLTTLSANQIYATFPPSNIGCSSNVNINTVQCALDRLFTELKNLRFIDLKDISREMSSGQLLKSCITRHKNDPIDLSINCSDPITYQTVHWEYINSIDIKAKYPDIIGETNVQEILWLLYSDIQCIKKDVINVKNDIIKMKQKLECMTYELVTIQNECIYLKNNITDLTVDVFDIEKSIKCIMSDIPNIHYILDDMELLLDSAKLRCCTDEDLCPSIDTPIDTPIDSSLCFCHMCGIELKETPVINSHFSIIFVEDEYSNIVAVGDYPDAEIPFPNAVTSTFDTMAIGASTYCQFWSDKNFTGTKFLDVQGPMVIYNSSFFDSSMFNNYPDSEFVNFPRPTRKVSSDIITDHQFDNMRTWQNGSLKITCS